jgi:hypothetical protein
VLTVRELLWESLTVLEPEVLRVVLLSLIISIASGLANLYRSVGMSILVSSLTNAAWSALFVSLLLPAALGAPRPPIGSWLVAGVRLWLPTSALSTRRSDDGAGVRRP